MMETTIGKTCGKESSVADRSDDDDATIATAHILVDDDGGQLEKKSDLEAAAAIEQQKRQRIEAFRMKSRDLRISASNIAAMCGLHPWKNLPELFLNDLVYQGSLGKMLLKQDAALLGLSLVDPELILRELAEKAGSATKSAVRDALRVKDGTKVPSSVQACTTVKEKVVQEAKKKLSKAELKILEEGVRSAVDTGFGTAHEDDALNLYQEQTGWVVEERNSEVRVWPFGLDDNGKIPTVVPLQDAKALYPLEKNCHNQLIAEMLAAESHSEESAPLKQPSALKRRRDDSENPLHEDATSKKQGKRKSTVELPFFAIHGSVDGIRDELVIAASDDKDRNSKTPDEFGADDWQVRKVIVECKHRMRRIHATPPLYEQIQAIAYCLMHNASDADIVQVLRTQDAKNKRQAKEKADSSLEGKTTLTKGQRSLDSWVKLETKTGNQDSDNRAISGEDTKHILHQVLGNSEARMEPSIAPIETEEQETVDLKSNICIQVSRVSLDDPIMQHRQQWRDVILPRLRSFVDAVYRVRRDDDKRYRMLAALSNQADEAAPWRMLFAECPWLETCDTAFQNNRA